MSRSGHEHGSAHPPEQGSWWQRVLGVLGLWRPSCAQNLTPSEDLQIAFQAASDGNLVHAAFHAGCVLKANPMEPRALGLVDRLIARQQAAGGDPLDLAPLGKKATFSGTAAVRAHVLARLGRYGEAMGLLRQVAHAEPETGWWKWGSQWLSDPGVAAQVDPDQAAGLLAGAVNRGETTVVHDPAVRQEIEDALPAIEAVAKAHPQHEMARYLHVMAVRKAGRLQEACRLADELWAASPTYLTAIARAMAYKAAESVDDAAAAFEDALQRDPDDPMARADLAELLCAAGRFDEALRWAEEAKRHDPKRETSSWVLWYLLKHRLDRDPRWLAEYREYEGAHPGCRLPGAEAATRVGQFTSYLAGPSEATINVLRRFQEEKVKFEAGGSVRLTVSNLEPPSSHLAAARFLEPAGVQLELRVENVPSPDPRVARGEVSWLLWRYEGTEPKPGLPDANPAVAKAVAGLAGQAFDLEAWTQRASDLATAMQAKLSGTPDASPKIAGAVLAVMVHPPKEPEGWLIWDWIQHVQVAAALVAAKVDAGWENSVRRQALMAMVRGPVDWTTEAGILALSQVYREEGLSDQAKREIVRWFAELAETLPDAGPCCYLNALVWAVLRVPPSQRQPAEAFGLLRKRCEQEDGS